MQLMAKPQAALDRPRIGFLGLGWIGRHRMQAMAEAGGIEIVALADPDPSSVEAAASLVPGAATGHALEAVLETQPDGVVIATPSALHAGQSIAALQAGAAVFCQKPLGRSGAETGAVVEAARTADRLLATDLSYRHAAAFIALREQIRGGELGAVHALDLTFHNAYGPDKPWFRDRALSGGGCLIDLGIHLVDMALWCLEPTGIEVVAAHARRGGRPLEDPRHEVEDYVSATLETADGTVIRLACSWNLPAGQDAVIGMEAHGTAAGGRVANIDGSFFDFGAWRHDGTSRRQIAAPPDDWGGRAAVDWAHRLAGGAGFDPEAERLTALAEVLDAIYRKAGL
ncbi:Gfo/Idh/MocA family protein [Paracoccus tibetensis]|uniref:Predicted dehydrogenase n=1 Tax=Paracoccus tibetensis TaxID=336292 RepID=A0A1G5FP33_9RHOB|nr:Gfo/Idh/MocA family oxidoreductase [Paracoccus tibetensis]SCY41045.1 Predicted dehydrogenase [Paracoccus tibetensis]